MGGTDSFAYVFVAGVSLFLIAYLLVSSGPGYYTGGGSYGGRQTSVSSDVLFSKAVITLDANQKQSFRHVNLGDFSVGHTVAVEPVIAPIEEITLKNGLFFVETSLPAEFSGVAADTAYLSFKVVDTNGYAPLRVILNGKPIQNLSISEKGKYVVKLEGLEEENRVELKAGSSGLRVWAPTVYMLEDVSLGIEQWTYKENDMPFKVYGYEYDGWHAGTVSFQVTEAIRNEDLIIEVNGVEIYKARPLASAKIQEVGFTKTDAGIVKGENVIMFKAGRESEYNLKGVDIQLFYYDADHPASQTYSFDVSESELDEIMNATAVSLAFNSKPNSLAALRVYFNDNQLNYDWQAGENEISLSAGKFVEGKNRVEFSTFGAYTIEDMSIKIL